MVAKSVKWVLAGILAGPSAAMALGLGDIHLNSTLNAPLDASIDLVGATPDELATLTPKIASRDTFAQHGLDWPAFLSNVTVKTVHTAGGRDVLELRSTQPVTEPFLTLLVELDWDRGHFVREYTVLLDPPVYTPNAGRVAREPVQAPTTGAASNEGTIQRAPASAGAEGSGGAGAGAAVPAAGAAAGAGVGAEAGGAPTYTVRSGDSLSRIASKIADRPDEYQWMVATYRSNPEAFDHNMNELRAGAVLRIPSKSAVDAISTAQAGVEVHRQYVAWRGSRTHATGAGEQPGRLQLVAPGADAANAGAAGAGQGTGGGSSSKSLQGEVQTLQAQLAETRRLLDLKNAQLAQLQARLGARGSTAEAASAAPTASAPPTAASAAPATPAAPPAVASSASAASAASAASVASTSASSVASAAPTTPAAAPPPPQAAAANAPAAANALRRPVRRPAAVRAHPAPQSSWLDSLGSFGWVIAALIAALLAFLGLRTWNARRKAGFDDSLGRLAEAGGSSSGGTPSLGGASSFGGAAPFGEEEPEVEFPRTAPLMAPKRESTIVVEETGTHERPRFDDGAEAPAAHHVEAGEGMSADTALNLDQGDPLAEADFHMAYGLYDQAADLVRIAIQREPERRDLKLKLLEVFFVWGNKEQFLATARELAESRTAAAPGEWEKIVIMGKQLAPDDPLFAAGAGVSGAAAGGVDLDLVGGEEQGVDFDVLGTQSVAAHPEGVDLDIGSAIGERDPAAEAAAQSATDRNLTLDENLMMSEEATAEREAVTATQRMLGADSATGSTREMTAQTRELTVTREITATVRRDANWEEGAPEAPTVEQPALRSAESPSIRQKVEMALRAGSSEHTTEVALDDLGLDLTALAQAPDAMADHEGTVEHEATADPDHEATQLNGTNHAEAPTMVAGFDEHSRRLMESAARGAQSGGGELKVSETGTWHFDEDPLVEAGAGGTTRNQILAGDLSDTSRLAALKGGTVDFEIGEPTQIARTNGAGPVDLDVGTATVPDVGFTKTQRLGADDLALPDLDPVTMSEVGTKLDLARAYMDMGDPEGARNILEEVLNEGSVGQKQEAQRLIASLPG